MATKMKYFLIMIFIPLNSFAAMCDISDNQTNSIVKQYPTPCDQSKFTGDYGDPAKTTHILDTDWRAAQDALVVEANAKEAKAQPLKSATINCVKNWVSLTPLQQNACMAGAIKILMLDKLKSNDL